MREQLLSRMIRIYGFENEITIEFARLCENDLIADFVLCTIVECHEKNPQIFLEDEE